MRVIFIAQLVLGASLKITDQKESQDITRADMEEYHAKHHSVDYRQLRHMTAEERQAHLEKVRLQMQGAFEKNSLMQKAEKKSSLVQMKKKAALKNAQSSKTPVLKKELAAGVSLLQQVERAEMMEKIGAYKVQVEFQMALDKKVNEVLLRQETQKAAALLQMDVSQMTPTDRKNAGLMSEAELKMYAVEEARMNELLKDENAARKAIADAQKAVYLQVLEDVRSSPHYLRRAVSVEDMMYLIDKFGGPTLKQAAKEVSMLQTSSQKEEPEEAEVEVEEAEPQNKMMERMNMAASVASDVNKLANSDWANIIGANMGHPVKKLKFAGETFGEFNKAMGLKRAAAAEKKKAAKEAEEAQA